MEQEPRLKQLILVESGSTSITAPLNCINGRQNVA